MRSGASGELCCDIFHKLIDTHDIDRYDDGLGIVNATVVMERR
jgi:hypothetical protein